MDKKERNTIDPNKWCGYIVKTGQVTAVLIILAQVIWLFAASNFIRWPLDVYLQKFIVAPAIGLFVINLLVSFYVRSPRHSLLAKEYISLSLFVVYCLYLSLSHNHATVLLCSYIIPIFTSTIFSNMKLTHRIFLMSMGAVLLPGVKWFFAGTLNSDILMEIFTSGFMLVCSYILAKILIQYGQNNLTAIVSSHEEATKNELAFLQAQIKPHFLYNALNTIVSFGYKDREMAENLLINLSKYLRLVFDVDPKSMMVPLEREIELIKNYVEIEKARFGELIHVEYEIDPTLRQMELPSFCLQPLVENAIKHGLCKKETGGTVYISAKRTCVGIVLEVRDTGIGMPADKLQRLKTSEFPREGVGFFNVKKRISSWKNASVDVQSTEGVGTSVTINVSNDVT
ncbi:MAG: histidine kinase [Clostridiales bacterium]|jgi:sensor histidine kinase YesM|nr:histidine kinase [Clostridiales bacterium]MCI2160709.1 histidine kinase [Oscillospiraceae bacterium]MCI1961456.1 histidine kinase [Clostridiales bacterium]MCI2022135.1 histidine kinase [Clostridiales bacterium]MCI2025850.1 histidine kinase [Clostridiales bacterium]